MKFHYCPICPGQQHFKRRQLLLTHTYRDHQQMVENGHEGPADNFRYTVAPGRYILPRTKRAHRQEHNRSIVGTLIVPQGGETVDQAIHRQLLANGYQRLADRFARTRLRNTVATGGGAGAPVAATAVMVATAATTALASAQGPALALPVPAAAPIPQALVHGHGAATLAPAQGPTFALPGLQASAPGHGFTASVWTSAPGPASAVRAPGAAASVPQDFASGHGAAALAPTQGPAFALPVTQAIVPGHGAAALAPDPGRAFALPNSFFTTPVGQAPPSGHSAPATVASAIDSEGSADDWEEVDDK